VGGAVREVRNVIGYRIELPTTRSRELLLGNPGATSCRHPSSGRMPPSCRWDTPAHKVVLDVAVNAQPATLMSFGAREFGNDAPRLEEK